MVLCAIMKSCAPFLPFDPDGPSDRSNMILADVRPRIIVTTSELKPRLQLDHGCEFVLIDALHIHSSEDPVPPVTSGDNLAYVLFTSGSTGQPKGVMNTHGGLANRLAWMQHAMRLQPGERLLQKTTITFDVAVWEFFWPLMEGATLVMAAPGDHRDPARLCKIIREEHISTLHF